MPAEYMFSAMLLLHFAALTAGGWVEVAATYIGNLWWQLATCCVIATRLQAGDNDQPSK